MKLVELTPHIHTYVVSKKEIDARSTLTMDYFDTRFEPFILSRQLTMENLAEIAGIDFTFDYALPMDWVNRERAAGRDITYMVWGYPDDARLMGRPINLMSLAKPIIIQRIIEQLTEGELL